MSRITLLKTMLLAIVMMVGSVNASAQATIAAWTFPTSSGNAASSIAADCGLIQGTSNIYADGTNGSDNWSDATSRVYFAGTIPTTTLCSETAATGALSLVNTPNAYNGKSIVFKMSTIGYKGLKLNYATRGTSTGFTTQAWSYSTDGTTFTPSSSITGRNVTTFSPQTVDFSTITGLDGLSSVYIKLTVSGASGTGNNRIDNVEFTATAAVSITPTLTVTPATLTGFAYQYGSVTPSAEQSFKVSGTLLTNDVSIAPSANYEISLATGDLFVATNPIALTQTAGVLTDTPIYVRLKTGLAGGSYAESITVSSTGATPKTVACNGSVACVASSITFSTPLVNKTVGNANFTEVATSTNAITAITYSSSVPAVATVNASTGEVTVLTGGTTDISANQISSDGYCANTAKYTLNVVTKDPTITITEVIVPDMAAVVGNFSTEKITVSGVNLTAVIGLAISGTNSSLFKVSQATVEQTDGTAPSTEITITYSPIAAGSHTATLTLTSAGAYDAIFALKGISTLFAGISNVYTALELSVINGKIVVSATEGESIAIYNTIGQQLFSKKAIDGVNTITVPTHGVLIVKVGTRTAKVII